MEPKQAALGFSALAQETRLNLMRLLAARGASGLSAGEIATELGQPPSTLSFHLAALEQAGLVQATRRGRHLIYAVRFFGLRSLFSFLTETCCGGRPELCGDLARLLPDDLPEEEHMTAAFNVLFLCTGNSARSIIAESILRKESRGRFRAFSAGSAPKGNVNPYAIRVLERAEYPTNGLRSKSWLEFASPDAPVMDFVFTVCDDAAAEACPVWPGQPMSAHWGIEDPAAVDGTDLEKEAAFVKAQRYLKNRIVAFVNLPLASIDRLSLGSKLRDIGRMDGTTFGREKAG